MKKNIYAQLILTTTSLFWGVTHAANTLEAGNKAMAQGDFANALQAFTQCEPDPQCTYELAGLYKNAQGVKANPEMAIRLYEKAANSGHVPSMFEMGLIYDEGKLAPANDQKALKYYLSAADNGHVQAMRKAAEFYLNGNGTKPNLLNAMNYFSKAAELNDVQAQADLGSIYLAGDESVRDPKKAFPLLEKAAQAGHPHAQQNLGVMYRDSIGVQKDLSKAFELTEKSAIGGNADAMANMHAFYFEGQGVKKDMALSGQWLIKSAKAGNVNAQYFLYTNYLSKKSELVPHDIPKAIEFLKMAADNLHPQSLNDMGVYYSNGQYGFEKRFDLASIHFAMSASKGSAAGKKNINIAIKSLKTAIIGIEMSKMTVGFNESSTEVGRLPKGTEVWIIQQSNKTQWMVYAPNQNLVGVIKTSHLRL